MIKISNRTLILFAVLIIVVTFGNSLKNDFAWDDKFLIINNPYIKDFSHTPKIFTSQLYEGGEMKSNFYRPLQLVSFAIDYSVWKLNPFGYHLTSLILHIANSTLVYYITLIICSSVSIAFLAALLFGISPVISSVTFYIPARADLLMALFALLSFLAFLKYTQTRKKSAYAISVISFILALLSKEMALILPFLLVIEIFRGRDKKVSLRPLFLYFIIFFIYIFLRATVLNFAKGSNALIDYSFPATIPLGKRILTDLNVIASYIRLLLFPSGLHMQSFIKPANGLFEINVILPAALILLLAVIVRKLSRYDKIFLYSLAWFFVCLTPVLNIYPVSVFLHEMWLYLPSVGFYIFFSAFLIKILARKIPQAAVILFITLYTAFYCLSVIAYGKTWKDSISLFNNDLKYGAVNPFRHLIYNNMAMTYYNRAEFKKSAEYCKKSILLNPGYSESYNNLGVAYIALSKPIKAIKFFKKAITLDSGYIAAYCNLASAYHAIGLRERAVEFSKHAISVDPAAYKAYCNLGYACMEKSEIAEAVKFFKKAVQLRREYPEPHYCLGNIYIKNKNYREALSEYKEALKFGLNDYEIYNKLGFAYIKNNKFKEAEEALRHSLGLNKEQYEPHNNLGNLYYMFGYFDLAIEEYRKALEICPGNKGIIDNIKKVKELKSKR